MSKIFLKYTFIFDPRETWRSSDDFETDLAALFRGRGLQAERVDPPPNDEKSNEVMIIIGKLEDQNG